MSKMASDRSSNASDWQLATKLLPWLKGDAVLYSVALIAAPFSAILVVLQPYLLKVAIDDYILPGDTAGLQQMAMLYLGAVVAAFAFEAGYTLAISYAAMRSIARLRDGVFRHTLSLAQSFFDTEPTGRLLTRATSDVEALGETLTAGAVTIVLDAMLVVGIITAMMWLDWRLTAVMLLLAPVLFVAVEAIRRVLRRLYLEVRTSLAALNAYTAERLGGVQVIQLYSDEERALAEYDKRLWHYRDTTIRTNIWDALLFALVDGLGSVTMALMLWYGSGGLLEGTVTAGLLAAFIDYVAKLFRPIGEFSQKVAVLQRASTALQKIFGLLDHSEHISDGTEAVDEHGAIVLDDVHFAYGDGPDVLKGVSLVVAPGEVVALVGRTGSGKTTIGKLLIRCYDGYRGTFTVGGTELRDLRVDNVRRLIGAVPQDVQLFPGDVRFNLTLGHDIPDEQLWDAIRVVHAEEVVKQLGGLEGHVEHGGGNLSVGQGQLLSFARTMAQDPPIVILDEATASVDTLTEAAIQQATAAILARKTVLVIAHRLSTITNADRIAVLDAGVVIELGSHTELMDQEGRYAALFRQQLAS